MITNYDLNDLIGVPFKLNRRDFKGCDCRGIVWLYYKHVMNKEIPFTDGKRIFFRNKNKDFERITNVLKTFTRDVSFKELEEGDIVVLKGLSSFGALGVCINKEYILHMDKFVGSCLTKTRYMENLILSVYRPI